MGDKWPDDKEIYWW